MTDNIINWLANGERGMSSEVMAFAALGKESKNGAFSPLDPSDLNRCIKLVKDAPEVKDAFLKISGLSDKWKIVIDNWDRLVESFVNEVGYDWCLKQRAPNTYKLMKELGL